MFQHPKIDLVDDGPGISDEGNGRTVILSNFGGVDVDVDQTLGRGEARVRVIDSNILTESIPSLEESWMAPLP